MTFDNFDFAPSLLEALDFMGFKEPSPIQAQAIPLINQNKDLIACAQTGTGKTGAFLLPAKKQIQYFLLVYDNQLMTESSICENIRAIDLVHLVFSIDVESVVNKENLITT